MIDHLATKDDPRCFSVKYFFDFGSSGFLRLSIFSLQICINTDLNCSFRQFLRKLSKISNYFGTLQNVSISSNTLEQTLKCLILEEVTQYCLIR